MNLNQLKYFVSVATHRSFTKAAEVHFLTQTAITQQIRALEDDIGLQLFDRSKRPIELTPAGEVFLRDAKTILARTDSAVQRAQEAARGAVGTIRIGYEKGYERADLSDRLRDFHRTHPNIVFLCIREDTDRLAQELRSGELDIIFSWDSTNMVSDPEIDSRLVMRSPLAVALYADHPLAKRAGVRREDLRDETILYMTPSQTGDSFGDVHFMHQYEKAGYQPKILLKSNDVESLLIMVAAEEGITILPMHTVAKLTNADNLVFLPLDGEDEFEDVFMMWKRNHGNSALQCFTDFWLNEEGD